MRIAILSLGLYTNYGGILQSYALQHVLQEMGHDVDVIDKCKIMKLPLWKKAISYPYRFVLKYILGHRQLNIFLEQEHNRSFPVISREIAPFISKNINTRIINQFSELKEGDYDAFVVGSDQVWRKRYFCGTYLTSIENAYLAFAKRWAVKRIAYAASFGTSEWEYSEKDTAKCGKLLKLFSKVSLRELSGVQLCKMKFHKECSLVLDPTLLLNKKNYERHADQCECKRSIPIVCYILDMNEEKMNFIKKFSDIQGKGYEIINSYKVQDVNANVEERIQPSIESWLFFFRQAEFVITDSYHACVFSIIFEKPFYVVGSVSRGISRYESLLEMLGLQDRLICTDLSSFDITSAKAIDYLRVRSKLDKLRALSINFLKSGLN